MKSISTQGVSHTPFFLLADISSTFATHRLPPPPTLPSSLLRHMSDSSLLGANEIVFRDEVGLKSSQPLVSTCTWRAIFDNGELDIPVWSIPYRTVRYSTARAVLSDSRDLFTHPPLHTHLGPQSNVTVSLLRETVEAVTMSGQAYYELYRRSRYVSVCVCSADRHPNATLTPL